MKGLKLYSLSFKPKKALLITPSTLIFAAKLDTAWSLEGSNLYW